MTISSVLFQTVALGAIAGVSAIMTWRRPSMLSWAYVGRVFLALLWVWGLLAVAVWQIWRAAAGTRPDSQTLCPFAPGAALIGLLLVALFVFGHAVTRSWKK